MSVIQTWGGSLSSILLCSPRMRFVNGPGILIENAASNWPA